MRTIGEVVTGTGKAEARPMSATLSPNRAKLLQELLKKRGLSTAVRPPISRRQHAGPCVLSFAQQRLWFIDQLEPDSALYNIPVALRVEGRLDISALSRTLSEIVRRHEVLRTVFDAVDGEPFQVVLGAASFSLPVVDLSILPQEVRQGVVQGLAAAEAARPFDLTRGPLLRVGVLRLGPEEHVALMCMHHIVGDGWSMNVLIHEVMALYSAFAALLPSPLPELPIQYADFAAWQREWLSGEVLDGELAYWRRRLGSGATVLELPFDRPRPAVQTFRAGLRTLNLPAAPMIALKALAARANATLFMTLLAALQVLLGRYSGQSEVSVGMPIAGRNQVELEGLIGFFVNTLVLRTDLTGNPGFRELLARVREVSLEAQVHQELPFEKIVEELAPERSLSHSPLFQVMLDVQNQGQDAVMEIPGLEISSLSVSSGAVPFDLLVNLGDTGSGLRGMVEFNADLFDGSTIDRMLGHFATLLTAAVADSAVRLSELPLMSAVERGQLLREWNDTALPQPAERYVHELFESWADRTPEQAALVRETETWSYAELEREANRLAHCLRRLGVGPEVCVGVCAERGPELAMALLATHKAGGVYLPLDPAYPRERLAFIMADACVPVLLAQERFAAVLPASDARVIGLDAAAPVWAQESARRPAPRLEADHLAYVIYTSGSTGRPKGIGLPHRTLSNLIAWQLACCPAPAASHTLQFASPSFDVSLQEVFATWAAGGTLVVADEEARRDVERLVGILAGAGVERLFLPFVALQRLAEHLADDLRMPTGLREIMTAGERLQVTPQLAALFARLPDSVLRNQYGPSEAHVVSEFVLAGNAGAWPALPPIGRPIADTTCYVLDRALHPVPLGVPGELVLGGAGLARGYLNRPDLTAERFIPDALGGAPGRRLYRTGDLARTLPDGNLEFLGRIDHQVKVRGYRVELGEIESVLGRHPSVRASAVTVREDRPGDRRLVAYVVAEPEEGERTVGELRRFLGERLPEYMVPSAFVLLAALPLSPNGKVDHKALPAPEWRREQVGYLAPRTVVEEVLAGIWAEVLGVDRVGALDHFFELGGHSLLATQVMSRLRSAFQVDLPLRELFEEPTVSGLSGRVEAALRSGAGLLAPPLVALARQGPMPLSFAQQRLWFIDQLEPDSALYNIPVALRVEGRLDISALSRTLSEIVRRHEVLRTVFDAVDGEPFQVVLGAASFSLPVVDLSILPQEVRQGVVQGLAAAEAARPFDLTRGPLLRVGVLRLGPEEHVALMCMHHIVSDGWSMGVLVGEVTTLYEALRQGLPNPLPELPIQYADFAHWQHQWLSGEVLECEVAYWRQRLAGAPPLLELPTDRPRPVVQTYRGTGQPLELSRELSEALWAFSRREGVTLFMTLLAAFQLLLSRYSGQRDLSVGTPIAGRNRLETEGLIGFFVNTLVLRGDLSGAPSFRELLNRVRESALAAHAHQDVPFEKLVEELEPERSLAHSPLFQVVMVLQNAPRKDPEVEGLRLRSFGAVGETSKFDLTLALEERDGLKGAITYSTELFDGATIERLLGHYASLLAAAVVDPEAHLSELPLLGAAEQQQLLVEWNQTAVEHPGPWCIHELFEAQAERTPEALAVVFGADRVSYRELDRRANQLAHHLQGLGVGLQVTVGLCLERSVEMVMAILGVLKTGAAYVPLDPEHPREHLAFLLADAEVSVLLTQARMEGALSQPAGMRVVYLDRDRSALEAESAQGIQNGLEPDAPAYVIYTSGTTGRPKGAVICHRSVVNYALGLRRSVYSGCEGTLQVSLNARLIFDASIKQICHLFWGHCLHVVPEAVRIDADGLVEFARRHGLDVLDCVPSQLKLLLSAGLLDGEHRPRWVLVGGEALDESTWRQLRACDGTTFFNHYGPSECTVNATICRVAEQPIPSIGRPIANVRVYVLDREMNPLPVGVAGELHVGGAGIGMGYLNRAELTAASFVPDPVGGRPGDRLYRTGDLARWRADGALEFLGRLDHQVKVRGFRIELEEIETVLRTLPEVREAVVVAREDVPGDRRLVAYVVGEASVETLRRLLVERLPEHMVPSAFVLLAALPLSPNGKVDRKALPEPEWRREEGGYLAPRTVVEEVLAGIWSEVLGVDRVGASDHFFELGGHSLLATQVMSRLRSAFQVDLPLRELFEEPTVSGLSGRVEAALRSGAGLLAPPLVALARQGPMPLSFAQQRLWFIDQLEPDSALYNIPVALRVEGRLDVAALGRTLSEIVRRHEVLRTVFASVEGVPVQVIRPAGDEPLAVIDLSGLPERAREPEAQRLAWLEGRRPFDLARGPLLRVALLLLGAEHHVALLNMHHIVSDDWSMGLLVSEVTTLYGALHQGLPSPLPELPIQYTDFASWQRQWLSGEVLKCEVAHWRQRLAGAPPLLELPTDRPRPAVQTYRGSGQPLELSRELSEALRVFSRREGVTLFMTLLAAFQLLLSRYSGQHDLTVGTSIAGRNRLETEGLIGFFVNTLVLRGDLSGAPSFRELLNRVRETALAAHAHQDVPFEMLVKQLQPERSLSHEPLFQVMLTLETARSRKLELPGLSLRPVEVASGLVHFDLTLGIIDEDGRLLGSMDYRTELFDGTTITRMNGHLRHLLQSLTADPQRPLSEVGLLTECERGQTLLEWNDTVASFPRQRCLHELFEIQVERTPDAVAVLHDQGRLTYRELNRRANRLARELRSRGVGPETVVAIYTARSVEMTVAFLGVLKAGGAYAPLDPDYPRERLAFLLGDSGARILLTQERFAGTLDGHDVQTVLLDRSEAGPEFDENPTAVAAPSHLAYVIYTSGSTGRPKGVLVPHSAVVNYALEMVDRFGLGPADRVLQFAALSFDVVVEEVFPTWLAGGAVVLKDGERLTSLRDLRWAIENHGVTVLELPAAYWHEWVYDLEATGMPVPPTLRLMIVGSEKPLSERVEAWRRRGIDLIYIFGLTETTVTSSLHKLAAGAAEISDLPIGRPIANTRAYLLDSDGQAVPVGVPGELHLGGEGVARGYLGRPELTAARFVPDPFDAEPGRRLYQTGDLARYRADGNLEFLGRIDEQVKLRGIRVEPAEVEAALCQHPSIREAIVVARRDAPGDSRLVAYLISAEALKTPTHAFGRTDQVELWPSQGCYGIYDEVLYYAMTSDEHRNRSYRAAIEQRVKDKVVVDIGTGADIVLSRMCVEAGAEVVYAIEQIRESFDRAAALVRDLGLEHKIHLIHGASTDVELPEKADVVVSELIGTIGSSEGAIPVLNDAWRFLRAGGVMIPQRCLTRIAAVRLPERLGTNPAFTEVSSYYVEKVFDKMGAAFDLRLCIRNLPRENLISTSDLFEDLFFTGPMDVSSRREVTLTIDRDSVMDGFLLWVNLNTIGEDMLDILDYLGCWSPLFVPVFYPGIEVCAGDRIQVSCTRRASTADRWRPDYRVEGVLLRQGGAAVSFEYDLPFAERRWRHQPYYERLFSENAVPIAKGARAEPSVRELREHLLQSLPEHMVPPTFVFLPALPLTPNGKVDRRALPAPAHDGRPRSSVPPRDLLELQVTQVWEDLLGRPVGLEDHFFEVGGYSLLAVRATARLEGLLGRKIPVAQLLHHPTVEALAALLRRGGRVPDPPLVALRSGGKRSPLFFVHPIGGSVLCYHDLARHLGADRPFYGVQVLESGTDAVPNAGIEAMAAGYLERLRSVAPEGPYLLGGWSMGGVVAYEMARQLTAAGQDVALLALVDAFPPRSGKAAEEDLLARIAAFALELGLPAAELDSLRIPEASDLPPQDLWDRLFAAAQERGLLPPEVPAERLHSLFAVFAANAEALRAYRPQAFPGQVSVFLAADEDREKPNPAARWEGLATAGVAVYELPGDHYSILREPGVALLAARLREAMEAGESGLDSTRLAGPIEDDEVGR